MPMTPAASSLSRTARIARPSRVSADATRIADHRQHRDAEREIGLRRLEQIGPADIRDAIRAVGEPDRVDHHQRDDLLERNRHHGEVMAAEPQGRSAEQRAGQQRHHASAGKAQPVADMIIRGADADDIGAEAEERGLRQVDLAAQARARPRARTPRSRTLSPASGCCGCSRRIASVAASATRIAAPMKYGRWRSSIGFSRDAVTATGMLSDGRAHAFSATRSPKMPCGRNIRNRISTRKAKPSLYGTEIYAAPKVSIDAERQPADDRTRDVAETADDGGGKGFQRDRRSHLDRDEQHRRDQNAGKTAQHRRIDEGDHDHAWRRKCRAARPFPCPAMSPAASCRAWCVRRTSN